jgi:hypothetical protein
MRAQPRHLVVAVVVAALATCAAATPTVPKAKWWQDEDTLYLSIAVACVEGSKTVTVTPQAFSLQCTTAAGAQASLAFDFREDVADGVTAAVCATKGGTFPG